MQKFKFWVLAALLVLCVGLVVGCGTSDDNNGSSSGGNGATNANPSTSMSDNQGNTSTNGANNTEDDNNNGAQPTTNGNTGNEGSVVDNPSADGVVNELVTDIGQGIKDLGN